MALSQVGLERLNTATTDKIGESKNLIINGQFDIWQRGTDSGSNTTDGVLACDRWMLASSGATKQVTRQSFALGQTDVPSNPKYFLRYAVTTGNNNAALRQRIEGVDTVQGAVTLSFYAKGTNPAGGSFDIINRQNFGTGGSPSSVVDTSVGSFSVTSSWARKTFTFTPPSISGKTLGTANNDYYELEVFRQPDGDSGTAAYTVDIANVQLEVGSVATDFEYRSFADELIRCKRYFEIIKPGYFNLGRFDHSSGQAFNFIQFQVTKRNSPSGSIAGTFRSSTGTSGNISFDSTTVEGASIFTANSTSQNGILYILDDNGDGTMMLKFDAEL